MARDPYRKRRHTAAFKVEAVKLMQERLAAGVTLQRVSEELEIGPDLLRTWAKQIASAPATASADEIFPGAGHRRRVPLIPATTVSPAGAAARPEPLEDEVRRLRRENERLRLERDFLKKATAFFAKESQ
jgi:transposase